MAAQPLAVGRPGLTVTIEPRPGGRIYERTPAGVEHDWGEVLAWEPPTRLAYLWDTYGEREDATTVTILHRGWERLGARGEELRRRNRQGWDGLLPHYLRACPASGPLPSS